MSPSTRVSWSRKNGLPRASRAIRSRSPASGTWCRSASDSLVVERVEVDVLGAVAGHGGLHQDARRPQREDQQVRRARRAAEQVLDELDRGVVGPVEVVEQQRQRPLARQQLEQRAQRTVVAEALRCRGGGGRVRRMPVRGRGQDRAELRAERLDPPRVQRGDVVVERGDRERERHLALVLGGAARERQQPRGAGALGGGLQQRGLADPRLADDHQHARASGADVVERPLHRLQLRIASYEIHRGARRTRDPLYSRRSRGSPLERRGARRPSCRVPCAFSLPPRPITRAP